MIEVVTQTWFEKECKNTLYTPIGLILQIQLAGGLQLVLWDLPLLLMCWLLSCLFMALPPVLLLLVLWTAAGKEEVVEEGLVCGFT
jgi:hypothetical protein